jgi:GTP-dependent phosphoenolpyruvate carboxykinase
LDELLNVNPELWRQEFSAIDRYLGEFGERAPAALKGELERTLERVHSSQL